MRKFKALSAGATAALVLATQAFAAEADVDTSAVAAAAASDGGGDGADILVTARRREERAQDVPIPLTVLTGARLNTEGVHTMQDIVQRLPGTTLISLSPRGTTYSVRGIGATTIGNDGLESSTGIYIDGVYLGQRGMAIVDLNDIDQVEFLRGPQGTLFGKNTTTGAFNFTTRKPSFTPEINVEGTVGNYKDLELRASVSGPLIADKLAARLTAYGITRQGFLSNPTTGGHPNGRRRLGLRGQLLALPTENLSIRLIGEYHKDRYPGGIPNTIYDQVPTATFLRNVQRMQEAGYDVRTPSTDRYARETTSTERTQPVSQTAFSGTIDWDAGGLVLTSITAYRQWEYTARNDVDQISVDVMNCCGFAGRQKQFSQELRVSTQKGGAVEATAGLYYFWQNMRVSNRTEYGSDPLLVGLFFGAPAATAASLGNRFVDRVTQTLTDGSTHSYAAFAQADWHASERLTLTGGLRGTYERKSIDIDRDLGGTSINPAVPNVDALETSISNWALGINAAATYKISDSLNLYASYGRGQKSGTLGTIPVSSVRLNRADVVVEPEKIDDFELGLKSSLLDRRLNLNLNLYYSTIRNYQTSVTYFNEISASTATRLANAKSVRAKGVEVELAGTPLSGWSVNATAAYNYARFKSFANASCPPEVVGVVTCDATGKRLMGAPKWTSNVSSTYTRAVSSSVDAYLGGSYAYRSGFYGTPDFSEYAKIKGYGLVNLWAGVRFLDGAVDLSVWGRNVFDKDYYSTMGGAYNGAIIGFTGDPATYGATVRLRY